MRANVIHESTSASLEGRIAFPQVVANLSKIGIERYHADLVRKEKVFYAKDGETFIERLVFSDAPEVAPEFRGDEVQATVKTIQRGEIQYQEFLRRVMRAGTSAYDVFIDGRHAVYYGRKGETYVENFPNR